MLHELFGHHPYRKTLLLYWDYEVELNNTNTTISQQGKEIILSEDCICIVVGEPRHNYPALHCHFKGSQFFICFQLLASYEASISITCTFLFVSEDKFLLFFCLMQTTFLLPKHVRIQNLKLFGVILIKCGTQVFLKAES